MTNQSDKFTEILEEIISNKKFDPQTIDLESISPVQQEICMDLLSVRQALFSISNGNLDYPIKGQGYMNGLLKNLQASLKHLAWQTKSISEGDYTQKVDFLGEFSESFNSMTHQLEITIKKLQESELRYRLLADTDKLTQLNNRLKLDKELDAIMEKVAKQEYNFSLIMMDIDHFKMVNDNHGHQVGDTTLSEIAGIIKETVGDKGIPGRWGGEEFLIVLPDMDLEAAVHFAQNLCDKIAQHEFPVIERATCSFGVTSYAGCKSAYQVISHADEAMYQAKKDGRNCVRFR